MSLIDHFHFSFLLKEVKVTKCLIVSNSVVVLLAEFKSFEGKFPVNCAEEFEADIWVPTVNELLDYLVYFVNSFIVWFLFIVRLRRKSL